MEFDKTERNNGFVFDKTERNNGLIFDKTERNVARKIIFGRTIT